MLMARNFHYNDETYRGYGRGGNEYSRNNRDYSGNNRAQYTFHPNNTHPVEPQQPATQYDPNLMYTHRAYPMSAMQQDVSESAPSNEANESNESLEPLPLHDCDPLPYDYNHQRIMRQAYALSSSEPENFAYTPLVQEGPLVSSREITAADVICGRGAGSNTHPGNIMYRSLISDYKNDYYLAKPIEKAEIAKGIVAEIKGRGGRFLKRSGESGPMGNSTFWFEISDKAAREKTCQSLRERDERTPTSQKTDLSGGHLHKIGKAPSAEDVVPTDQDVLLGRGGVTNSHIGNRTFRVMVRNRQEAYLSSPKLDKSKVAMSIVEDVKARGGRFLTERGGKWIVVSSEKAREKTSQRLREKASEVRKRLRDTDDSSRRGSASSNASTTTTVPGVAKSGCQSSRDEATGVAALPPSDHTSDYLVEEESNY